jgi:hypothetical protein
MILDIKKINWITLSIFLPILCLYFVGSANSFIINVNQYLIMFISLILMGSMPEKHYTLIKIVAVYFFFFFGVIPLNDLASGNSYWGSAPLTEKEMILPSLIVIIGLIFFIIGIYIGNQNFYVPTHLSKYNNVYKIKYLNLFLLLLVSSYIIFYVSGFNIYRVLFRGLVDIELNKTVTLDINMSQIEKLIFNNAIKPIPIIITLFFWNYQFSNKHSVNLYDKLFFVLIFSIALFFSSPTSMPRFQTAALYLAITLVFTKFLNRQYAIQIFTIFSLLVVFPFLDKFRNFDRESFNLDYSLDFLNHGHFDGYHNLSLVINNDLVTYGYQFMTALLFFVPRSLWSEKGIGSGAHISNELGLSFDNISMPYLAEGYINFGVFGVIMFMVFLGVLLTKIDNIFWNKSNLDFASAHSILYKLMIGMVFFIMRGDLLSSLAYTIGLIISFYIVHFLVLKSFKL